MATRAARSLQRQRPVGWNVKEWFGRFYGASDRAPCVSEVSSTSDRPGRYAIVLAGGDGTRLREVTERLYGYARPKQFCRLGSAVSLLEETVARALRFTGSPSRVLVVTSRPHHAEVEECLESWPTVARIEQPRNLDTTPGILLPLLHVAARDPLATVLVLPSDHHISDDAAFIDPLCAAVPLLAEAPQTVLLAGAVLRDAEPDLGWIVPGPPVRGWRRVAGFVEKPPASELAALHGSGALANTFAFLARVSALTTLFRRFEAAWWEALTATDLGPAALEAVYRSMPAANFSRDVLANAIDDLGVVALQRVQWCDIGTPERLSAVRQVGPPARAVA